MDKEILMPRGIWEGLKGKSVILAGNECELRQKFQDNLVHITGRLGNSFEVVSRPAGIWGCICGGTAGEQALGCGLAEERALDCRVAGEQASGYRPAEEQVLSDRTGRAESDDYIVLFAHPENMELLLELLEQLQQLVKTKPRAAVLVSDNRVYGKLFGDSHPLKTDEIGYACHTMQEDIPVTNLRTAEHFACRLVREEGLNIRVARAEASSDGEILSKLTEAVVRLLLEGEAGAVYNLPMQAPDALQEHSPLEPIPIITATGK